MRFIHTEISDDKIFAISLYRGTYGVYQDNARVSLTFSKKEALLLITKLKKV